MKFKLTGVLIIAGALLVSIPLSVMGYDNLKISGGGTSLLQESGNVVTFVDGNDELGSSGDRILAGYFDEIDVTSSTFGTVTINTSLDASITDSQVLFSNNGVLAGDVNFGYNSSTGAVSTTQVVVGGGSAMSPGVSLTDTSGNQDLGIYSSAADTLGFSTNQTERFRITNTSFQLAQDVIPITDNAYDFGRSDKRFVDLFLSGTASSSRLITNTGSSSLPSIVVLDSNSNQNNGFFSPAVDTLAVSTNGSERVRFNNSGIQVSTGLYPRTDNAVPFGISTLAWADGYFKGSVTTTELSVNSLSTATTTMYIGDADTPACVVIGDNDGAGVTYLTTLNGTGTFSTTDCR